MMEKEIKFKKLLYLVVSRFFSIISINLSKERFESLYQFVKFGIIGLSNTLISYLIYTVCLVLFRKYNLFSNIDYFIAQFIMFFLSVLWSFYWNNRFVFNGSTIGNIWSKLIKTYITYAFTSLFLSEVLLVLWVNILGISEFVAPIINLIVTVPLNFIIQKFWAFKDVKNS